MGASMPSQEGHVDAVEPAQEQRVGRRAVRCRDDGLPDIGQPVHPVEATATDDPDAWLERDWFHDERL